MALKSLCACASSFIEVKKTASGATPHAAKASLTPAANAAKESSSSRCLSIWLMTSATRFPASVSDFVKRKLSSDCTWL